MIITHIDRIIEENNPAAIYVNSKNWKALLLEVASREKSAPFFAYGMFNYRLLDIGKSDLPDNYIEICGPAVNELVEIG